MSEIQTLTDKEGLPLASEVLVWPKENTLCLPRFVAPYKLDEDVTTFPVLSDHNCNSPLEPNTDSSSTSPPPGMEDNDTNIPIAETVALPELPKSREGLLELRAQLSMELLWMKQAIASRQEVCKHYYWL